MSHSLIFGMTESGKSTLAKRLSHRFKKNGVGVLVLDPLNDEGWLCDLQTSDNNDFLRVYWQSRSCCVFIDESGETMGKYDTTMIKTATRGRHWGHSNFYISQRGAQISKTVRDQCRHLFLFTSSVSDSKILANEFNEPELLKANILPQGHYYHVSRFGKLKKGQLW